MRIGLYCRDFFSPNGMTKATACAARVLREEGHEVSVLTEKAMSGAFVRGIKIRKVGPPEGASGRRLAVATADYDLFLNQLPGAFFPSFARRSWLWVHAVPLVRPRHLEFYRVLANSSYTQEQLRSRWHAPVELLPPPVEVDQFAPRAKRRLILSVGTLGGSLRPKNELALIRLFKKLQDRGKLPGWRYHLAGALEGGKEWLERLKFEAAGAPVSFEVDAPPARLRLLYGRAALLWHACRAEHFGMAIVEAMASGCVPMALDAGGPREIIEQGKSGWLYRSFSELEALTLAAVSGREPLARRSLAARAQSRRYGMDKFKIRLRALLAGRL